MPMKLPTSCAKNVLGLQNQDKYSHCQHLHFKGLGLQVQGRVVGPDVSTAALNLPTAGSLHGKRMTGIDSND